MGNKMGFWNRGAEESDSSSTTDFTSSDSFSSGGDMNSYGSAGAVGGGVGGSAGDLKQFAMALQQQVVIQEVMNKLTSQAFERCITGKPGDSLRGSEITCIHASVGKWLDTNDFMIGRLQKKSQNQQQF